MEILFLQKPELGWDLCITYKFVKGTDYPCIVFVFFQ